MTFEKTEATESLTIQKCDPSLKSIWKEFLDSSNNGTLFHDLSFLAYHPPNRFEQHSLLFFQKDKLVAVLPACIESDPHHGKALVSPFGASIGGLVFPPQTSVPFAVEIVKSVQTYAVQAGFKRIEMRVGPSIYQKEPNDLVPFCLAASGFQLKKSWLTFAVPIASLDREQLLGRFSKSKRYDVRAGLKKGLVCAEAGPENLNIFFELLEETYTKHGTPPTHQKEEIIELFNLVPGHIRLFLCHFENRAIAGVLLFILNKETALTFYICESSAYKKLCGPAVLLTYIFEKMSSEKLKYVDLGPSASDDHLNSGVIFFKEGLGAQGFLRQAWRWTYD